MLGLIEYGAGNIASVSNALEAIGVPHKVISDSAEFEGCSHLILPGVGAFAHGMNCLNERGLVASILAHINEGKPFLGICLGMQLLFENSDESPECDGLGVIKGQVIDFGKSVSDLMVPHVGWNRTQFTKDSPFHLLSNDFYFVHSFYCSCTNKENSLGTTDYGIEFVSAVAKGNIIGAQFHPEKSHKAGLEFLRKFWEMTC